MTFSEIHSNKRKRKSR